MTDMPGECVRYAETMKHAALSRVQGSGNEKKTHRHARPCPSAPNTWPLLMDATRCDPLTAALLARK